MAFSQTRPLFPSIFLFHHHHSHSTPSHHHKLQPASSPPPKCTTNSTTSTISSYPLTTTTLHTLPSFPWSESSPNWATSTTPLHTSSPSEPNSHLFLLLFPSTTSSSAPPSGTTVPVSSRGYTPTCSPHVSPLRPTPSTSSSTPSASRRPSIMPSNCSTKCPKKDAAPMSSPSGSSFRGCAVLGSLNKPYSLLTIRMTIAMTIRVVWLTGLCTILLFPGFVERR